MHVDFEYHTTLIDEVIRGLGGGGGAGGWKISKFWNSKISGPKLIFWEFPFFFSDF